jgi:protein PET117
MSTASKLTLLGTTIGTIGIVAFVHWAQTAEKAVSEPSPLELLRVELTLLKAMHAGVVRDMEQQQIKRERQADFEMQRQLEEEYKKFQTVSDGSGTREPARWQPWSPSMSETYIGGLRLKERQLQNMKTVFFAADLIYAIRRYTITPVLEIGNETEAVVKTWFHGRDPEGRTW